MLVTVTAADADFCGVADVTLHYGLVSSDSMDHPFDRQFLHVTCVTENELCAAAERDTNQGDFYLPPTATVTRCLSPFQRCGANSADGKIRQRHRVTRR